ncbi:SNF2 family N-terminal domain-containing protein [Pseudomassariella vexata]|uniref:SNF2 family N-terminal domain-domain-containing protein n=1 Tax=Pseudomassariella vexata TaxID=1141098 RepID=A0A1Y2DMP0_9PEZI|nr:SNF2 family N-terminal domain-containing protein [Pseudomassariella vexata]ORY60553.1 SNF2 family N-terminal domain-domain-containing protein [Pseudomassariella vexata]
MLFDGSTILLQNGSTSNPYGTPGSGGSLLDIANRTNHYDYQNGTDGFGNPIPHLPQQIRDYVEDYMGNPQKTAEEIRNLLSTISPDMEVPPEGQEGTPDGLKVFLYRHQKMALKWMENMEADNQKKGGILADDMGLGKTVSTIALMLSRRVEWDRFNSSNRPVKTNVIVGPVALIKQWEREIDKKVNYRHRFEVHNYHSKKVDYNTLRQKDIVLTTYGTLGAELKKFEEYVKKSTQRGESIDESHLQKLCPFLSPKSQFHRVVLDEAQCIKNKKTQAAKAAGRIVAEYRWCLSGTPMMNSVSELASLINFLRIKPYCETDKFSRTFGCLSATRSGGHNRDKAMRQLQTLLKAIMMRRSKTSIIDGKPIIDLKPKIETVDHVVFNEDDGQFYRDLETESRVTISKYLREGTVGKHYSIALVLLLRLRQACCHPYLHLTDLDYGNNEIPEDVMLELAKTLAPAVVNRIKEAEGFECPICYDAVDNPSIMLPCGHDTCAECLDRLTGNAEQRNLQNGNEGGSKVHCPECRGDIDIKKVITYEYFKKVHMPQPDEATTTAAEKEETASESEDNNETDSEDETDDDMGDDDVDERGNLKDFVVNDDNDGVNADDVDPDTTDLNDELGTVIEKSKATKKSKRPKKNKGKAKQKELEVKPHMLKDLRKDAGKSQEAYRRYMRYLKKIWLPSAKVTKCQELIADIQQTGEKTIVFSQWTLLLDLLEIPIKHELKLGYRRYDGGMSATQRDHAVRDFMENDDVKVILVSLKAGNAGLNLTSASQVIIMDPFWNPYIEMQAIDRAHRIGQQNTVKVHRVLIENTVEDRIVLLQEKKRKLVDAALDEGAAKNIGRLNADDLAYLFGIGGGR